MAEINDTALGSNERRECRPLGDYRLRTWSEGGKRGRMFIYFVGIILASYVRSVWQKDDVLRKKFSSTEAVLAEMRTNKALVTNAR